MEVDHNVQNVNQVRRVVEREPQDSAALVDLLECKPVAERPEVVEEGQTDHSRPVMVEQSAGIYHPVAFALLLLLVLGLSVVVVVVRFVVLHPNYWPPFEPLVRLDRRFGLVRFGFHLQQALALQSNLNCFCFFLFLSFLVFFLTASVALSALLLLLAEPATSSRLSWPPL